MSKTYRQEKSWNHVEQKRDRKFKKTGRKDRRQQERQVRQQVKECAWR